MERRARGDTAAADMETLDKKSGQEVHDGEYAAAMCRAAEEPRKGDVGSEAAARVSL